MILTKPQAREIARLLGKYQMHLESTIPKPVLEGTKLADDMIVAMDKHDWRTAVDWSKRLREVK